MTNVEKPMVSLRSMRGGRAYLRLLDEGARGDHLHVDIALAKIFPRGSKPEITAKTQEILNRLAEHKGHKLEIMIVGRYLIDIELVSLDSGLLLTGTRAVVSAVNHATGSITGARLAIDDENIEMIRWDLFGSEALIDIYGSYQTAVSDDYLVNAFNLAQEAFSVYILGEKSHEP